MTAVAGEEKGVFYLLELIANKEHPRNQIIPQSLIFSNRNETENAIHHCVTTMSYHYPDGEFDDISNSSDGDEDLIKIIDFKDHTDWIARVRCTMIDTRGETIH